MSDLISRDAAIRALDDKFTVTGDNNAVTVREYIRRVFNRLCDLPSAQPEQPEIIRCKDCKQFRRWIDTNICFCDITESEISDDDFCSRAERRRG